MAKKFGKFLLFTAAAGSAAAAVYYYMQKKDSARKTSEEDDYDNFTVEEDETPETSPHYVPLTPGSSEETPEPDSKSDDSGFTPLSEQIAQAEEKAEETVEAFFDEDSEHTEKPSEGK